jgi:hypothetical protein
MQRRLAPRKWVSDGAPTLPCMHERAAARNRWRVDLRLDPFFSREAASQGGRLVFLPLGPWVGGHVGGLEALDGDMGVDLGR